MCFGLGKNEELGITFEELILFKWESYLNEIQLGAPAIVALRVAQVHLISIQNTGAVWVWLSGDVLANSGHLYLGFLYVI